MKIGHHLKVVTLIKDMNPDLNSGKKIELEKELQDSGDFCLKQTFILWIVMMVGKSETTVGKSGALVRLGS